MDAAKVFEGAVASAFAEGYQKAIDDLARAMESLKHEPQKHPVAPTVQSKPIGFATDSSKESLPIEDLDLNVRAYNCLKKAGIHTVEELAQQTKEQLLELKNFGHSTLAKVEQILKGHGIYLSEK